MLINTVAVVTFIYIHIVSTCMTLESASVIIILLVLFPDPISRKEDLVTLAQMFVFYKLSNHVTISIALYTTAYLC